MRDNVVGLFQQNKTKRIAQIFQAFRIATNNELNDLAKLCEKVDGVLNKNGICLFITFHSIERKIIKECIKAKGSVFSKIRIELPSKEEIQENSKSHSAQMLCFKKKK